MANKIYVNLETPVAWSNSSAALDHVLSLVGSGGDADAVRVGDRRDLGAIPHANRFEWRMIIGGFDAAPVVGEAIDIYLSTSDGTYADGVVPVADADWQKEALPNLLLLGSVIVQTTTQGDQLIASGFVEIDTRYVSPVTHNQTVTKLSSAASGEHRFILTPAPLEVQ